MAHTVFHTELGIVLNLTEDDLGHPEYPGLWNELYPNKYKAGLLRCVRGDACPENMYLKVQGGKRQAIHCNPSIKEHAPEESDEHKALKEREARVAQRAGFAADIESRRHGRIRPDVVIHGTNGFLLGCEVQVSNLSPNTVRRRTTKAIEHGIRPLWTTNDAYAALIDRAPWARIDKKPWQDIANGTELPVRGGVRRIVMVRCDGRGMVCPDRRLGRRCQGWHPKANARELSLDSLVVGAAAQQEIPVLFRLTPQSKGNWYWVTADDRDRYATHLGGLPGTEDPTTLDNDAPAVASTPPQPLSWVCNYGLGTWQHPEPHGPRDSGEAFIGASVGMPDIPSRITTVAPSHPPVRRGVCGSGTTPCGAPARLYPCGWRCDPHAPGALRKAGDPL